MSGPFGSSQWMYSSASGFYPHTIGQSLRFEDGDSPRLTRTPSSAGNRKTWTWSAWIKRGNISTEQFLFQAYDGASSRRSTIKFNSDNTIAFDQGGGASSGLIDTVAVYRDVSSFYHIVVVADYSNGTAGNRAKIYVNGVLQTVTTSDDFENADGLINSTNEHSISFTSSSFFDGYMSEVVFLDGVAGDPTTLGLGELKDGIWVPKNVSGLTYGTNGFHLDFADSSAIGNDVSGNDNDFAVSGLAATDVVLTSPTNTFATLNPLNNPDGTFSEGNLKWTSTTTDQRIALATMPVDALGADDSYAEVRIGSKSSTYWAIGVFGNPKSWNPRVMYRSDGVINRDDTVTQTGVGTFTEGDIMSITYDVSSGTVTFYKNNSSVTTETVDDTDNVQYFGCTSDSSGSSANYNWNFGQDSSFAGNETAQGNADANGQGDFYYTPPSGFLALCSANLPEPEIIDGSEYFNTVLYTGTGGTQSITSVNHQPDLVWIKTRNTASHHVLTDSVRGVSKQLFSSLTNAETTEAGKGVTSFDSDGFTLGTELSVTGSTNSGTYTYASWNWLAGTAVSGATTGSGTAKAYSGSVNTESGFSIITYKGNGTAGHTIPHNLGAKPSMVLFKNRDVGDQWAVYHKDILATHNLCLNNTDAAADQDNRFNDTEPTSSVMTLGTGHVVNATDEDYIAYFFTDIDQYCKAGKYIGNNSNDGPFAYTGFRPAFVIIKESSASGNTWVMFDNKRDPINAVSRHLRPNSNAAEVDDADQLDFLSNGFKLRANQSNARQNNGSGNTYIYMAFAEQPFKYANAK